jgi:hypothetical protein
MRVRVCASCEPKPARSVQHFFHISLTRRRMHNPHHPTPATACAQMCRSSHRKACAVCGMTAADGAQLRRCAGCGLITGVVYCGDACCRRHWVKLGHRRVCERAQVARVVDDLITAAAGAEEAGKPAPTQAPATLAADL